MSSIRVGLFGKAVRVPLVQFESIPGAHPDAAHPILDHRDPAGAPNGPVVGATKGATITLRLRRLNLSTADHISIVSKSPTVVDVKVPKGGAVPPGTATTDVQLHCKDKGDAVIEVRWGGAAATDPLIHELTVHSYPVKELKLTPYLVSIQNGHNHFVATATTDADVATAVKRINAAYASCGIAFKLNASRKIKLMSTFADATVPDGHYVALAGEANMMLNWGFDPTAINVYFVPAILADYNQHTGQFHGTFALGYYKDAARSQGINHPLIVVGDRAVEHVTMAARGGTTVLTVDRYRSRVSAEMFANDLAHEIGHYFSLEHVERENSGLKHRDTWSRRRLMSPSNPLVALSAWKNDYGAGSPLRGYQITQRHVGTQATDDECKRARDYIQAQGASVYDF